METSSKQQQQQQRHQHQQQEPVPSADPTAHKAFKEQQPNSEVSTIHQYVERPFEIQEHHRIPSTEKIVMDVAPSTCNHESQKEAKIAPEPRTNKPAADANSSETSAQHHPSDNGHCNPNKGSTGCVRPSAMKEDYQTEPFSSKEKVEGYSGTPAGTLRECQRTVAAPSQQQPVLAATDPLQAPEKTDPGSKLTAAQPSANVSTELLLRKDQVELLRDQVTVAPTAQGDVENKYDNTSKELEASQTISLQEVERQYQSVEKKQMQVLGNSKEKRVAKESQVVTPRSSHKPTRAEIDTAAPFESVKAAVSMFGERMDWKAQTRPPQNQVLAVERRISPESELYKAQNDLVHYKDQLGLTQASTAGVLLELNKVKRLIQNPASKPRGTEIPSYKSLEAADTLKNTGSVEFLTILREVQSVKEELISATVTKEAAVKGLQDALSSLNTILKRLDELGGERNSLDEAVADAHMALADAEEQVALLKSGQKVDSLNSIPSDFMEKKSAETKGLESKLEEAKAMIVKLKDELVVSKKAESLAVAAASETQRKTAKVKLELDQAKSQELSMAGKLASVLDQSEDLKAKLEKAMQENSTLSSLIQTLKAENEECRKQLESMHGKEQTACASLASLQEELHGLKGSLRSAQGSEARAIEAKDTLPTAIKQVASEADQAKAAAEATKEEARRARQEIEQAKAATSTALSRQQAALKELEAAKVSEAMALAELKVLTDSELQSADKEPESEEFTGVTITLEEYSALKQAAVEAEGLADKKVTEVIAQVEEAKSNQEKAQLKLDEAAKEAEECQKQLSKAQKQADNALEAKLTAEAYLRKWRAEHDLRRKSGGAPLDPKAGALKSPQPEKLSEDEKLSAFGPLESEEMLPLAMQGKKSAGRDSLAQVISLDVTTSERLERLSTLGDPTKGKVKAKRSSLMKRLTSVAALNRKP